MMEDLNVENLQQKLKIADAAAQIYPVNGSFTMHEIAAATDLTVGQIFRHFGNKKEIIRFFYRSLVIRYRLMIDEIADFQSYTLSEKFSNFAYASFDLMQEREEFVQQTFRSYILRACEKTTYEKKIESLFNDFFEHDTGKSASSDFFINDASIALLRKKYLLLVSVWLNDDSEGHEMTTELVDKLTGLLQEVLYTSMADRTLDLAKFLYTNNVIEKQLPCWKRLTESFEIH